MELPDDTFVEQPDTPAPVFAARAFKRAIFGTPAPKTLVAAPKQDKAGVAESETTAKPTEIENKRFESPSKPTGILLTPGTATSRRKRVSFGRDVKSTAAFGDSATRPQTRLQEALENSRKRRNNDNGEDHATKLNFDPEDIDGDDAWEEVDDLGRDPDMTVDLNDPRSQSGRYWKSEFHKYHGEARAEMEKLVKYKQLAKSFAKAKDAEAFDLNQRLREEQAKVAELKRTIAEMTGKSSGKQEQVGSSQNEEKLKRDLERQTALVTQYKTQVEELQTLLKDSENAANSGRHRKETSLRSIQSREMERLRQELQRIKSDLIKAEKRELESETEKDKLTADLTKSSRKIEELERKLTRTQQDCERKNNQLEKLKFEIDALKEKSRAQREESATLKRGSRISQSVATRVLRDGPEQTAAGRDVPDSWAKKLDDSQARLKTEQEARRRDKEDASFTLDRLRQEDTIASELRSPATRKRRSGLQSSAEGKMSALNNDTEQILHLGNLSIKRTPNALGRPAMRLGKRTASGRIVTNVERADDKPATALRLRRLRTIKEELQKNPPRRQHRPVLQEQKQQDLPNMAGEGASRTVLSSERRAAAIARLEKKRAERRQAQGGNAFPGKENAGLYENIN